MTSQQRIDAFKRDLQELLNKHEADIETEEGNDYCNGSEIYVYMRARWGEDNKLIDESADFTFYSMGFNTNTQNK